LPYEDSWRNCQFGSAVNQLGHMATSTQNWGTPIVLYLRRAHL
jgi:hypothetical protein